MSTRRRFKYDEIYEYYLSQGCELLEDEYISCQIPMKYRCKCGNISTMKFSHFKQGHRCRNCGTKSIKEKQKHSYDFIKNFFEEAGCKFLELTYKNARTKHIYRCNCGNISLIKFDKFRKGHRCNDCRYKKISEKNSMYTGELASGWNPNRDEIKIKNRLRESKKYNWIINNMKDDPLYDDYLNNKNKYQIDHIIPIGLFAKIVFKYNLNPDEIKPIINKRDNLQILTVEDNSKKRMQGNIFQACQYLMLNGIKLIKNTGDYNEYTKIYF